MVDVLDVDGALLHAGAARGAAPQHVLVDDEGRVLGVVEVVEDVGAGTVALRAAKKGGEPGPDKSVPVTLQFGASDLTYLESKPLSRWLEREDASVGVETAVVASAKAALDRAARQPIDLAIVDLVLPDGDGLSVAFELVRRRPELRVVIMTGGGPANATRIWGIDIYKTGFTDFNLGGAAAMSVLMFAAVIVVFIIYGGVNSRVQRRQGEVS